MSRAPSSVFRAAEEPIRAVAQATVPQVAHSLLFRVKNAATYHERSVLADAQARFVESQELFMGSFAANLREAIDDATGVALRGDPAGSRTPKGATDWMSVGLVDEGALEESIGAKRIGQVIGHAAEKELRELDGYACAALGLAAADPQRNPLGADVLGSALQKSIERISDDPVTQKVLAREVAQTLAEAMPGCYRGIVELFVREGVRPVDLPLKTVGEAPARRPELAAADAARRAFEQSWQGRPPAAPPDPLRSWEQSILGRIPRSEPLPPGLDVPDAAALLDRLMRGAMPAAPRGPGGGASPADQQLTEMLRRLAASTDPGVAGPGFAQTHRGELAPDGGSGWPGITGMPGDTLSGLVAVNLIRAHQAELAQGARSKVDHLVIEVVGSLFDQILSDARVPPQIARQIARLQLPVLRVALDDPRFFSSRRHPLRRFINRVASLGSAVEGFRDGVGASLLARIAALVGEIVEGDFSELEVYDAKLDALQRFVAEQLAAEVAQSDAGSTLREKEAEVQQVRAFGAAFAAALEPLALPAFVRDFLCGPWAQAVVVGSRRYGADSKAANGLRQTARDLVASLQPKRTVEERKRFIVSLPMLMGALKDGMAAIGWPESQRDAFFGELMAVHAGSLKAPLPSDLEHNLRMRQLDQAVRVPLPSTDGGGEPAPSAVPTMPVAALETIEPVLTPEEQKSIGLVVESAVDWSSRVETRPTAGSAAADTATAGAGSTAARAATTAGPAATGRSRDDAAARADADADALPTLDPGALDAPSGASPVPAAPSTAAVPAAEPEPELVAGASLREHLQLGLSYQLNLSGRWEKVRLTYMSPSRTLFMFTHGAKDRQSVSMTARTLARLCEAGRMRAGETAYLVERSTERLRASLATAR